MKNVAFYDILYLWLYYRPVDRKLFRNLLVDPSRRQVGPPGLQYRGSNCFQTYQKFWSFLDIHKVQKWLCICENEVTIDSHHGPAVKKEILVAGTRVGARWLGAPSSLDFGAPIYNTLHLTHSIYVNKNINIF